MKVGRGIVLNAQNLLMYPVPVRRLMFLVRVSPAPSRIRNLLTHSSLLALLDAIQIFTDIRGILTAAEVSLSSMFTRPLIRLRFAFQNWHFVNSQSLANVMVSLQQQQHSTARH